MSELKPVDGGLAPEVRALAEALRDLFPGLGVSTRRYAARRAYDSSTVSRYLSGRRLPPWEFVLNLLYDVAEKRGTAPTQETVDMLRSLHAAALRSGDSPAHRVQLLERQLAEADQEARRAATRERWLEDALQDREHHLRDLTLRHRELEARASGTAYGPDAPAPDATAEAENSRLREEIRELREELARTRALHQEAEERCERLERQLAKAETEVEGEAEPDPRGREPDAGSSPGMRAPVARDEASSGAPSGGDASSGGRKDGPAPRGATVNTSFLSGVVHGDVHVVGDTWRGDEADEEVGTSVTARLLDGDRHLGNGLLLDGRTVLTSGEVLWPGLSVPHGRRGKPKPSWRVAVPGREVGVVVHAILGVPGVSASPLDGENHTVTVLRLAAEVPYPESAPPFDWRLTPGRQLLVAAHEMDGAYSCLLDVTGRSGAWLRVSGEIVRGLAGAPAFATNGAVAGLVMATVRAGEDRGLLLPAATLRDVGALDPAG